MQGQNITLEIQKWMAYVQYGPYQYEFFEYLRTLEPLFSNNSSSFYLATRNSLLQQSDFVSLVTVLTESIEFPGEAQNNYLVLKGQI